MKWHSFVFWLCAMSIGLVIFNQYANSQEKSSPTPSSTDKGGGDATQPPSEKETQTSKLPDGAAQRATFEREAKKLVMGDTCEDVTKILADQHNIFTMYSNHDRFGFSVYLLPDALYCVYLTHPPSNPAGQGVRSCPCDKVEVFRLPLLQPKPKGLNAYIHNFLDFLTSDRSKSDAITVRVDLFRPATKTGCR